MRPSFRVEYPLHTYPDFGLGSGGISGLNAQNESVPVAGAPFTTLDALEPLFFANGGGGVLQIAPVNPAFLTQATWHFNAVTGNDAHDGLTAGTALKTFAEYERRIGHYNTLSPTGGTLDLFVDSAMPGTDPFNFICFLAPSVTVNVTGTAATIVRSGTFDAVGGVTSISRATNQAFLVKDSAVASWAADIPMFITVPSGPNAGTGAWVAKNIGGGTHEARTSNWVIVTPPLIVPVAHAPADSDPYNIVQQTTITLGLLVPIGLSEAQFFNTIDLDFQGAAISYPFDAATWSAYRCRFQLLLQGGFVFLENCCLPGIESSSASIDLDAGLIEGTTIGVVAFPGASIVCTTDALVQGAAIISAGGTLITADCAVFDTPADPSSFSPQGDAVVVTPFPALNASSAGSLQILAHLYGQGAARNGLFVGAGTSPSYANGVLPTITGTRDFQMADQTSARAFDETQGAGAAYSALVTCTWAHLAAAIGAGGFGGAAHNVNQNAHLVVS